MHGHPDFAIRTVLDGTERECSFVGCVVGNEEKLRAAVQLMISRAMRRRKLLHEGAGSAVELEMLDQLNVALQSQQRSVDAMKLMMLNLSVELSKTQDDIRRMARAIVPPASSGGGGAAAAAAP